MVGLCEVDLRKDGTTTKPSREVRNQGKLIRVMFGCLIQTAVVATRPPVAIRFFNAMQRRGPRGVRPPDDAGGEELVELGLGAGELLLVETAGTGT